MFFQEASLKTKPANPKQSFVRNDSHGSYVADIDRPHARRAICRDCKWEEMSLALFGEGIIEAAKAHVFETAGFHHVDVTMNATVSMHRIRAFGEDEPPFL
jgi:hypothetical protein